jgi:predicted transcriptional regulator
MGRKPGGKYSDFIAVRLEPEMRKRLKIMAEGEERPLGMMARILLREAMESREERTSIPSKRRRNGKAEGPG